MTDDFVHIDRRTLKLSIVYDGINPEIDLAPETLDTLLQATIDSATTGPSDLSGLIVLHASLRRWSKYASRAIKFLEREMTRPGYLEDSGERMK